MSKVKNHFTSRWGKDGVIIEFDWSQLEVCVFAFLTQDTQLLKDLNDGTDIHCALGTQLYGEEITKKDPRRQQIKPGTFLCIYGGGANKFAREHKVDLDFAKAFIKTFYDRYPMTKAWQDNLVRQVETTKYLIDEYTLKGYQKHEGYLESITGRRYYFKTNDTPDFLYQKGILTGFNPPEIKNYPVQGLATADIHLMALGHLWHRSLKYRDKYLLINTVHDSVVIDCKRECVEKACIYIKKELESVIDILKERFNINFNVRLQIDYKVGNSWGHCK
jgi:DNA polymerase I-like protein with 3'-5' exonuclease and polymerase domains